MALAIGLLLAAFCLVVLGTPFLRNAMPRPQNSDPIHQLRRRREESYQEVRVLQNDLSLGHLSQAEYDRRFQELRVHAAELLRQEEQLADLDSRLEEEIKGRRKRRRRPPAPASSER